MKELNEQKKQILKAEFPHLSFSEDLDIERYFELRRLGKSNDAIALYNNKLKRKYPNEQVRIKLISAYRKRDPVFNELLTASLTELAEKTIAGIKKVVLFITDQAGDINKKDVYSVVRSCETVVSAISPDRFEAVSFTDKYSKYAAILNFQEERMRKAAELIRQYVTDTLLSVRIFREQEAEKKRNALRTPAYTGKPAFDFSKITFTKKQEQTILIPSHIVKIEDKVLAYTLKYWNTVADYAFENLILLYSRKYATNHFNIFQAVKLGRMGKKRDEEILHNVLLNVVNGYYYSISGDLYLQREWARIKPSLTGSVQKQTAPILITGKPEKQGDASEEKIQENKAHEKKVKNRIGYDDKKKEKNIENKKTEISKDYSKKERRKTDADIIKTEYKTKQIPSSAKKTFKHNIPAILEKQDITAEFNGAVSEMIKRLTGKDYSIYKELFFKTVRPSIRRILEKSTVQKIYIFSEEQNKAEDIIFNYLEQNYENPYQNWNGCPEKEEVSKLGFNLSSIENIVENWVKTNL